MRDFPHARSFEAVKALSQYRGSNIGVVSAEAFMMIRALINAICDCLKVAHGAKISQKNLKTKLNHEFFVIRDKKDLNIKYINEINPRFIFFAHWSSIIPKSIHEDFECVIFHMTDLPYGRGGSPLQNLIVRGHKKLCHYHY